MRWPWAGRSRERRESPSPSASASSCGGGGGRGETSNAPDANRHTALGAHAGEALVLRLRHGEQLEVGGPHHFGNEHLDLGQGEGEAEAATRSGAEGDVAE